MEAIKLKQGDNIREAYGTRPKLFYNVEGKLLDKKGKNIKIEKNIGNKNIVYSLRLKEEILGELGDRVLVEKDNILAMKTEEKDDKTNDNSLDKGEVIKRLDLKDDKETKGAIEHLLDHEIPLTKENIESFLMSKNHLEKLVKNLDLESSIRLREKGIDLENDSLQKILMALEEIKKEKKDVSLLELLGLEKKLDYKEAEEIAKEIYGRAMGKDVYDSIIGLDRAGMEINRENIEKTLEIMDKAYDLQDYREEDLVVALKEELPINMDNLYRLKHSYRVDKLDKNIATPLYEQSILASPLDIEAILRELNLDINQGNKELIWGFLHYGLDISGENHDKIKAMKRDLEEIIGILNEETIGQLLSRDIDILNTELDKLIKEINSLEKDQTQPQMEKAHDLFKNVEELKTITDRELLELIQAGKDLKLGNLEEIRQNNLDLREDFNSQVAEKALSLNKMFNSIGDLDSRIIQLSLEKHQFVNLRNLYELNVDLKEMDQPLAHVVDREIETIIRQEYLNAKAHTSLNLIRASIKEGINLEEITLNEFNKYIDRKISSYREMDKLYQEVKQIRGREDYLVPKIMKNQLNMTLGDLSDFNNLLNSHRGLGEEVARLIKDKNQFDEELGQGIEGLENKIKEFTRALKGGDEKSKEYYKEILVDLDNLSKSFDFQDQANDHMSRAEKYWQLEEGMEKDLLFQIPIESNGDYKNINLIIPNGKKGIDKNNMDFYFNLAAENLGSVKAYLKVEGKRISIEIETEKSDLILENKDLLVKALGKIGYKLETIKMSS